MLVVVVVVVVVVVGVDMTHILGPDIQESQGTISLRWLRRKHFL